MTDIIFGALPAVDAKELEAFRLATRRLYDLKEKAFAAGDPLSIVNAFYAQDAVTVGPDGVAIEGRDAFLAMYTRMVCDKTVRIEVWNSYVQGDAAWEWTNFHVKPSDPAKTPSTFVILFLWTKGEDGWVCAGDMFLASERPVILAEA